jgi:biopolymer transport protein ExbD
MSHLSRRAKRILRRHSRKPSLVPLNLVSMIDVFTVLVFFLLATTASVETMRNPKELTLPTSLSNDQPTDAPVVTITKQGVLVQGRQVMSLADAIAAPEGKPLDALRAELLKVNLVQVQNAERGANTRGEVNVMADRDTPYSVLKKVLFTCGSEKFARIAISVAHSSKRGDQ